jgi:hypothetical protein
MSSSVTVWRVNTNKKLWNQSKYEEDWKNYPEVRRLPQSKGNSKMVNCPKKGDEVVFVYDKKIVMKGIIDSDGFEERNEQNAPHRYHSSNIGGNRPHTICNEFIWVYITEIGLSEDARHRGQRAWMKHE